MKNEKNYLCGFSYYKNMSNFDAFLWSIKLSANLLFLKSVQPNTHLKLYFFPTLEQLHSSFILWFSSYFCRYNIYGAFTINRFCEFYSLQLFLFCFLYTKWVKNREGYPKTRHVRLEDGSARRKSWKSSIMVFRFQISYMY